MIDDRLRILAAMKKTGEDRLSTIFLRQGHYVTDRPARRVRTGRRHDRAHRRAGRR